MNLKRPENMCWSSRYGAFVSLIYIFSSAINVIEGIVEDGLYHE
jgi:hypothetical protein